jgi:hypothetical protein
MSVTSSHSKWQYVTQADDYKKNQTKSLQKVYEDLEIEFMDRTTGPVETAAVFPSARSKVIVTLHNKAKATVETLNADLNFLKNALNPANLTVKNTADISEDINKIKGSYLSKLEEAHKERIKAVNENGTFSPEDKIKINDALNKHNEEEKKAANDHFEKSKKDVEEHHNKLGRLQSYGYVEGHILKPSGFVKDQVPGVVGNKPLEERFEEFKNMPPRKLKVAGVTLEISKPDPEGKMVVRLPNLYGVALSSGRTKAFAEGLVSTFHAQGCDSINLEGNFPENIKREIWMVANLKDPRMSVGGYAPNAKDEAELQKRASAKQQSQQQTPAQNAPVTPSTVITPNTTRPMPG